LGVSITWWSGISFPRGMRSPCPSISIAGSSRYSQGHVAMRKQGASKCSDRSRSSCDSCCGVCAQSWFLRCLGHNLVRSLRAVLTPSSPVACFENRFGSLGGDLMRIARCELLNACASLPLQVVIATADRGARRP